MTPIMSDLDGKTLLITGGTGSFGTTVLKRFLSSDIGQIIVYSRDEKKQEELRSQLRSSKVSFVIGDVRNYDSINEAMRGVDYVFHAAALKQVPSCEFFPMEAFQTNVVGTENVCRASLSNNIKRMVLLSTDKAVYPINAMGISKAMAEKVLVSRSRSIGPRGPVLCATRYGNVMASRGSVIPVFVQKIKAGLPLRITDPNMTRFMMTLEQSVDLVITAFHAADGGDVFVQKAPACTLEVLAQALQSIFNSALPVEIMGTRHGEKLYETLVSREEMSKADVIRQYFRIPADNRDLNYELFISEGKAEANQIDDYTSHNTTRLSVADTKAMLLDLPYIIEQLG